MNSFALHTYPQRSAQRGIPARKAARLRVSWFVMGLIAGVGITLGLTTLLPSNNHKNSVEAELLSSTTLPDAGHALPELVDTVAAPILPVRPSELELAVAKGDTLSSLLARAGVDDQEAHAAVAAIRKEYNPRKLTVGQTVHLKLTPEELATSDSGYDLSSLRIRTSPVETLELSQASKDVFTINMTQAQLTREKAIGGGKIRSSLYQTGMEAGLSPTLISNLINAYSYDVDFQRDIKQGDSFQVVYETQKTPEGQSVGNGKLLYASLNLGGQEKTIYHFTRPDGDEGFYDKNGNSVRKALLRTPINGARLSSGFGMRKHPILGYSKMHKGVDFAASTGTPIYSAGDGTVEFSGKKGGYGNYVRIKHNGQYSTAYAHMSKIAPKASRKGHRVRQGDIIGFVGSTGASTGPHLHYELLAHGAQVNPKNVKFQTGTKLEGRELANFKAATQEIEQYASRNGTPASQKLASAR